MSIKGKLDYVIISYELVLLLELPSMMGKDDLRLVQEVLRLVQEVFFLCGNDLLCTLIMLL